MGAPGHCSTKREWKTQGEMEEDKKLEREV